LQLSRDGVASYCVAVGAESLNGREPPQVCLPVSLESRMVSGLVHALMRLRRAMD